MPVLSQYHKGQTLIVLTFLLLFNSSISIADENTSTGDTTQAPAAMDKSTTPSDSTQITNQQTQAPQATMGSVARAVFTSKIVDREPSDDITSLSNDEHRIYFFTDLHNMAGQIITHQWEYNGKVMAEVKFKVGEGPRWRVYSSKNLLPEWLGEWKVSVIDESGRTLTTDTFNYTKAAKPEKPESSPQTTDTKTPADK